jgi:hypothetical protein
MFSEESSNGSTQRKEEIIMSMRKDEKDRDKITDKIARDTTGMLFHIIQRNIRNMS